MCFVFRGPPTTLLATIVTLLNLFDNGAKQYNKAYFIYGYDEKYFNS